jgi:hypothetical protein
MMALCVAERVGTTSSGGEGASQKQPQAKQEDAKQQCENRHDRHVGRQCRDAGVAADPQRIHEAGLWSRQLRVSRVSPLVSPLVRYRAPGRLSVEIEGRRERSVGADVCLQVGDLLLCGADGI